MRRIYVIFAIFWVVTFVSSAQNSISSNEVPKENETYPYTGQVVDIFNKPIKDVLVKSLSTNISMTTGEDGLYSLALPVTKDTIVFIKEGLTTCNGYLSCYNKYFAILDSLNSSLGGLL